MYILALNRKGRESWDGVILSRNIIEGNQVLYL